MGLAPIFFSAIFPKPMTDQELTALLTPAIGDLGLELVGIEFCPGTDPGGSALLMFSQGGALRLDVECLECELTDLGTDDLGTSDLGEAAESPGQGA